MDNIIKYVRNRNPLNQTDSTELNYTNLEDETTNTEPQRQIPRSYSSTADFKASSDNDNNEPRLSNQSESTSESNTGSNEPPKYYTVDQAVEKIGFGRFQLKLSILSGLAWMADAMEMMLLSILAPALHCDWLLNEWQKASITTVVFMGMMLSGAIWGKLCDLYGRKTCLVLCTLFTFYFGALSALSPIFVWILILRGLVGFGIGGAPQAVVLYAEFLPSKHRAKCVILNNVFWSIGAVLEVLLAILVMPTLGWRWLLGFSALPLLVFAVFCSWLPESVRYLLASGQDNLAQETLKRIADQNKTSLPEGKLMSIKSDARRGHLVDLLAPEHRRTTLLLWFIWFANAFSYYGIVLLTTEMFQIGNACKANEAKKQQIAPFCYLRCLTFQDYVDLMYTTFAEFPGLFLTMAIIELIGRRKTMAVEFLGFSFFTFLLNICASRKVLIFFLFGARCFISGSFQASYVYTPEYYPTASRAIGLGTCSAMARIGAIITPFIAQVLLKVSPYAAISIYGTVAFFGALACLALSVETKGKDLREGSHEPDTIVGH